MNLKKLVKLVSISSTCLLICLSSSAFSDVSVIVHPNNTNALSEEDISRIFLGKRKSFPDGAEAIPIDQIEGSPSRTKFVGSVLKKSDQQIKAYWAQLLFTGKGAPPTIIDNEADVKRLISENPNLIGYINSINVDDSVKVVGEF